MSICFPLDRYVYQQNTGRMIERNNRGESSSNQFHNTDDHHVNRVYIVLIIVHSVPV